MRPDTHQTPRGHRAARPQDQLARLDDMSGYQVADGEPDVRGWPVKAADGRTAGRVDSLIVDTGAMQVRYLDVQLDRKTLQLKEEQHVLVPLAHARLDDRNDDVLLDSMTAAEVGSLQPYEPGRPIVPGPASEERNAPASEFYGARAGSGAIQHRTDEDYSYASTVRRADAGTGSDEVRIPLAGDEEVVIEKHAVPTEEVVIRKKHRGDATSNSTRVDDPGPGSGRHH